MAESQTESETHIIELQNQDMLYILEHETNILYLHLLQTTTAANGLPRLKINIWQDS